MYEKLCAILDALRVHGISCCAVSTRCSGVWEIVCTVPIDNGVKEVHCPITYKALESSPAAYLAYLVLVEVSV